MNINHIRLFVFSGTICSTWKNYFIIYFSKTLVLNTKLVKAVHLKIPKCYDDQVFKNKFVLTYDRSSHGHWSWPQSETCNLYYLHSTLYSFRGKYQSALQSEYEELLVFVLTDETVIFRVPTKADTVYPALDVVIGCLSLFKILIQWKASSSTCKAHIVQSEPLSSDQQACHYLMASSKVSESQNKRVQTFVSRIARPYDYYFYASNQLVGAPAPRQHRALDSMP